MGPFSCENGKTATWANASSFPTGFNGAVLLRERKGAGPSTTPRGMGCFNGAVLLRERKVAWRRRLIHQPVSFNGAVLLRERKGLRLLPSSRR